LHDKDREIIAKLTIPAEIDSCRWTIGNRDISGRCDGTRLPAIVGTQPLSVNYQPKDGSDRQTRNTDVKISDVFILVLGDSFVSGEGNPHVKQAFAFNSPDNSQDDLKVRTPQWWDVRCHRSLLAGPALAAAKLAKNHTDISVTYVSFACSGAEITEGILDQYRGRETDTQALALFEAFDNVRTELPAGVFSEEYIRPQIVSARDALCLDKERVNAEASCQNRREPDILVLGVGVNDIGFSDIIMNLVKGSGKVNRDNVLKRLNKKFVRLKERYGRLSTELNSLVSKSLATGRRPILAVEYPDPTRGDSGAFCSDVPIPRDRDFGSQFSSMLKSAEVSIDTRSRPFVPELVALLGFGIDGLENAFAYQKILGPLNDIVQENAAKAENSWRYVGGTSELSRTHGYCSKQSWFNSYSDAAEKQYFVLPEPNPDDPPQNPDPDNPYKETIGGVPSGAMHPNVFGHLAISEILLAEYERVLAGK